METLLFWPISLREELLQKKRVSRNYITGWGALLDQCGNLHLGLPIQFCVNYIKLRWVFVLDAEELNSCPFLHQSSSFEVDWCSPVTETLHRIENDRTSQCNFTKKDAWGIIWIIFLRVPRLELEKRRYDVCMRFTSTPVADVHKCTR